MLDEIKQKIEEEIERLSHELNVELPERIRKAMEQGDLRENADYNSALERQGFVQARIDHLTQRMSELSKIHVEQLPVDRVGFGSTVEVLDLETHERRSFTLVVGDLIDLDAGHVSIASPMGQALLGARVDQEVVVRLPAGERRLRVVHLLTLPGQLKESGGA